MYILFIYWYRFMIVVLRVGWIEHQLRLFRTEEFDEKKNEWETQRVATSIHPLVFKHYFQ